MARRTARARVPPPCRLRRESAPLLQGSETPERTIGVLRCWRRHCRRRRARFPRPPMASPARTAGDQRRRPRYSAQQRTAPRHRRPVVSPVQTAHDPSHWWPHLHREGALLAGSQRLRDEKQEEHSDRGAQPMSAGSVLTHVPSLSFARARVISSISLSVRCWCQRSR